MRTEFEWRVAETLHELTPEPTGHYSPEARQPTAVPSCATAVLPLPVPSAQRHRGTRILPIAASIAVLAAGGAVIGVVATSGQGTATNRHHQQPAVSGTNYPPPAPLSNTALDPTKYSYRVVQSIALDANGRAKTLDPQTVTDRSWIAANGDIISFRSGGQSECYRFAHSGRPSFASPTRAFFAAMPTEVGRLTQYFRSHVQGSSTRDEAVFVAVGDALREGNALASPRLRAAMVAMLGHTPGVLIHKGQSDYLGRPALRADFVDQRIRPGEIDSYYFDPRTYSLLEDRTGSTSRSGTVGSGSAPASDGKKIGYDSSARPRDPADDVIAGAAFVDVVTVDKMVPTLPAVPGRCTTQ